MKLFRSPEDAGFPSRPVVTVGNFDGVHLGHRSIFETMCSIAQAKSSQSLVLSFTEHPRSVLYPEKRLPVITTTAERLAAIESCSIDAVLLVDFTRETAAMTASDFVERYIVDALGASDVVIGYDHAFGRNREGNIDFLQMLASRRGFAVTQVAPILCDGHPVSSSRIREEIETGDVEDAARYLGRYYSMTGIVVEGLRRGRTIGFPTANIKPEDVMKVVPADGVYATRVILPGGEMRAGVTNIGSNPTFGDVPRTMETHIPGFSGDLYGAQVGLEFVEQIRGEMKFSSVDELVAAIRRDVDTALGILNPE
jgi:riboflavin kinase/FMN adenylyltransferase